jgi:hypothetical protein
MKIVITSSEFPDQAKKHREKFSEDVANSLGLNYPVFKYESYNRHIPVPMIDGRIVYKSMGEMTLTFIARADCEKMTLIKKIIAILNPNLDKSMAIACQEEDGRIFGQMCR